MLADKINELINKKFSDIIERINQRLLLDISNIPTPWKEVISRIDIYSLFQDVTRHWWTENEIQEYFEKLWITWYTIEKNIFYTEEYEYILNEYIWTAEMDLKKLKTESWTTYIEIFQNEYIMDQIRMYYEDFGIHFGIWKWDDSSNSNILWDSNSTNFGKILLRLNDKSWGAPFLKDIIKEMTEKKFASLVNHINSILNEDIKSFPESGLERNISMRTIFNHPEDYIENYDTEFEISKPSNINECSIYWSEIVDYNEIFQNNQMIMLLKCYYEDMGIKQLLTTADKWNNRYWFYSNEYCGIAFDFSQMKNDDSILFKTISSIDDLKNKKESTIQEMRNKELAQFIEKIDELIMKEVWKVISKNSTPIKFRASEIFPIKEIQESKPIYYFTWQYDYDHWEPEPIDEIDYINYRNYENNFWNYDLFESHWKMIEDYYCKNWFSISLIFDSKDLSSYKNDNNDWWETTYWPYNYIQVEKLEITRPNE
jgi:hypothetical protein